jgi:hypothetical protein
LSVVNEVNSIYDFLKVAYSNATVERQDVPESPKADTFVVRLQNNDTQTETRASYLNSREFQLIYFGNSSVDVLSKVDELNRLFNNGKFAIPIRGSLRYIRVKGFSFTTPFKSASGIDAVIAVIQTETREARDFEAFEKITSVNLTVKE